MSNQESNDDRPGVFGFWTGVAAVAGCTAVIALVPSGATSCSS